MWTEPWWLPFATLVVEGCVGYPQAVYRHIRHPVVWMGYAIDRLERRWNRPDRSDVARRWLGVLTVILVAGGAAFVGYVLQSGLNRVQFGTLFVVLIATTGLAQHSLFTHVRDVLRPLSSGDLVSARTAVAKIVGRDTAELNESGLAAAALESLAESFNDGVVAPAFWLFVGGLPGLFAYKALNTADSLIGHREPRWRMFGWAAARADDVANLIPARLAGLLLVSVARRGAWVMWRDASKHASPNAGWPEAAMAGGLNIRLGGPATYDGAVHERPVFGVGRAPVTDDLSRGLRLYIAACGVLWMLAAFIPWPLMTR